MTAPSNVKANTVKIGDRYLDSRVTHSAESLVHRGSWVIATQVGTRLTVHPETTMPIVREVR
jgi:hypothetical protein